METDKRKKRKGIIVLTVIVIFSATCYFGYEYYKQQQTEKKIAYYNDIDNFKEFAVEGADNFKLENYHVSPPDYNNIKEARTKLKNDLLKLHPIGSDYRSLVHTLLKNKEVIIGSATDFTSSTNFNNSQYSTKYRGRLSYSAYIKINSIEEKQWHIFWGIIYYNDQNKIISKTALLNAGNTIEDASGTLF